MYSKKTDPFKKFSSFAKVNKTSTFKSDKETKKNKKNNVLDKIQLGLGFGGLTPGVGIVPDILNAGISAARGNYGNMAADLTAAIPFAGLFSGGALGINRLRKIFKTNKTPDLNTNQLIEGLKEEGIEVGKRFKIPSIIRPRNQPIVNNVTKDGVATAVSKKTGEIDAAVSGTGNKNVVGLYRDYVKGKPTNDFTSKMEITNPNLLKNFKTILNNTLKVLPKNHRLIEKKSISIAGLGVWNRFIKSGKYKEALDSSGKLLTRNVYLAKGTDSRLFSKGDEFKDFMKKIKSKYPGIKTKLGPKTSQGSGINIELPILVPE